jgi:hypothetical protein
MIEPSGTWISGDRRLPVVVLLRAPTLRGIKSVSAEAKLGLAFMIPTKQLTASKNLVKNMMVTLLQRWDHQNIVIFGFLEQA